MKFGQCHLCGEHRKLTYEHVPPEAAYNDHRVFEADIHQLIGANDLARELEKPKGKYNQRGAGRYTLCSQCNSNTGRWYGADYVKFARALHHCCHQVLSETYVEVVVRTRPLRVIKQILAMFCSTCPPGFATSNPKLVRYLLNPESRDYPFGIDILASLFDIRNSKGSRQSGLSGVINSKRGTSVMSEIAFPPFNLVMTLDNSVSPDKRLQSIADFRNYDYGEISEVRLKLYSLSVNTYLPGDYRPSSEIKAIGER